MISPAILSLAALFLLCQVLLNLALSREILDWVPVAGKRLPLFLLLWLLPVAGALLVYRKLQPGWFDKDPDDHSPSAGSSALVGLDSIFNPGVRHVIDAQKKGEITIKAEGEMYDRELPDFIEIDETGETRKNTGSSKDAPGKE